MIAGRDPGHTLAGVPVTDVRVAVTTFTIYPSAAALKAKKLLPLCKAEVVQRLVVLLLFGTDDSL